MALPRRPIGGFANRAVRAGSVTLVPGWENVLAAQMVPEMDRVGRDAYGEAKRLAPVDEGFTKRSIGYAVDTDDASLYVFAGDAGRGKLGWDARYSEFGAGQRGAATAGSFGPWSSPFDYGGKPGRAAQPFIRPAALNAVKKNFRGV